jgi:hypothetical protein
MTYEAIAAARRIHLAAGRLTGGIERFLKCRRVVRFSITFRAKIDYGVLVRKRGRNCQARCQPQVQHQKSSRIPKTQPAH